MDTVSPETRSRMMAAIHSHGTAPELLVRRFLRAEGWRYRVCDRRIAGRPDIVLLRARDIVEIRGCFWHRHGWEWDGRKLVWAAFCPEATGPQTHRAFWNAKFRANVRRDAARRGALAGGRVGEHRALDLRTWEKTPRNDLAWLPAPSPPGKPGAAVDPGGVATRDARRRRIWRLAPGRGGD